MKLNILILLIIVVIIALIVMYFLGFKDWLVFAVIQAKAYNESEPGLVKLRYAYDLAVTRYPVFAKILPYRLFKWLVDKALIIMEEIVVENKTAEQVIEDNLGKTIK